MRAFLALPALFLLPGCLAVSAAGAAADLTLGAAELAGKTVYYTGKGAVGLVTGDDERAEDAAFPVRIAENAEGVRDGALTLTIFYESARGVERSQLIVPANELRTELDLLAERGDVIEVYVERANPAF